MRKQMGRLIDFMHGRVQAESNVDALHIAAFEDNLNAIKSLVIDKKIDVNTKSSTIMGASIEQTPLLLAIQEGNILAAKLLVELGAEIELADGLNMTPLMNAASNGDINLVKLLLNVGASPIICRETDGRSALSFATGYDYANEDDIRTQVAISLIDAGADVEASLDNPQSILMLSARGNLPNFTKTLLEAGADPERRCTLPWAKNWTALDHAINENSYKAKEILEIVTKTKPIAIQGGAFL